MNRVEIFQQVVTPISRLFEREPWEVLQTQPEGEQIEGQKVTVSVGESVYAVRDELDDMQARGVITPLTYDISTEVVVEMIGGELSAMEGYLDSMIERVIAASVDNGVLTIESVNYPIRQDAENEPRRMTINFNHNQIKRLGG